MLVLVAREGGSHAMALAEDVARLAQIPMFRVVEREALRLLAFACETHTVLNGTTLFHAGTASEGGYLVLSGTFRLRDAQGRDTNSGPGSLLAETSLLREMAHEQDATATETATVFKVPRAAVLRALEEHPESAQRMLAFYAQRLHAAIVPAGGVRR
jgi:CRP-like cAMP-binding protein